MNRPAGTDNPDQTGTLASAEGPSTAFNVTGVPGSAETANTAAIVHGGMGNRTVNQHAETIQNIHYGTARSCTAPLQKDEILLLKDRRNTVTISWQQSWRRRSQTYIKCDYFTTAGAIVPVFVQSSFPIREKLQVDSSLQYGLQNGKVFYVYHDKEQTPYQHRFVQSELQRHAYPFSQIIPGLDLSAVVGNYLHDVE